MVDYMQQIARSLNNIEQFLAIQNGFTDDATANAAATDDSTEPSDANTATIFSSGPDPIELEPAGSEEFDRFDFGQMAKTVNIRSDNNEPVEVALTSPYQKGDKAIITVRPSDLPFSIGGQVPLNTSFMWARTAPAATNPAQVYVIAMG